MTVGATRRLAKLEESTLADLSPADRAHMVFGYAAAGDNESVRRIGTACPRKTYLMPDCGYVDRIDDLGSIAKALAALIERYRFTCNLLERYVGFPDSDGKVDLVFKCARRNALLMFASEWAGFDDFCRGELGQDARTILQGWTCTTYPFVSWLDDALREAADLAEYVEETARSEELLGLQHDVQEMWTYAWNVRNDPP